MKTAFNISSPATGNVSKLYIELSHEGLSHITFDNQEIRSLKIYRFDKEKSFSEKEQTLLKILEADTLLKNSDAETLVCYSFPESILSPAEFNDHTENEALIKTLYSGQSVIKLQDTVSEQQIINDYDVHNGYVQLIKNIFPRAAVKHQYSLLISKLQNEVTAMHVLFYFEKIVVILFKAGNLQIVQTYIYKAPSDVVYHLLNVSQQFDCKDCPVVLYGMIDKTSALYQDVHNYFLNLSLASLPSGMALGTEFSEYPDHFFAHLLYSAR